MVIWLWSLLLLLLELVVLWISPLLLVELALVFLEFNLGVEGWRGGFRLGCFCFGELALSFSELYFRLDLSFSFSSSFEVSSVSEQLEPGGVKIILPVSISELMSVSSSSSSVLLLMVSSVSVSPSSHLHLVTKVCFVIFWWASVGERWEKEVVGSA